MSKQFECSIPNWAINYIYDGEKTGLSPEKIKLIDKWLDKIASKWSILLIDMPESEPYFSVYNDIMGEVESTVYDVTVTVEE
jgi:hypothetical protein